MARDAPERPGLLKRIFGGGKQDCCAITIEELPPEVEAPSSGCCGPTAATPSDGDRDAPKTEA